MTDSPTPDVLRGGSCVLCGGPVEGFASGSDWWHNELTDCPASRTPEPAWGTDDR